MGWRVLIPTWGGVVPPALEENLGDDDDEHPALIFVDVEAIFTAFCEGARGRHCEGWLDPDVAYTSGNMATGNTPKHQRGKMWYAIRASPMSLSSNGRKRPGIARTTSEVHGMPSDALNRDTASATDAINKSCLTQAVCLGFEVELTNMGAYLDHRLLHPGPS